MALILGSRKQYCPIKKSDEVGWCSLTLSNPRRKRLELSA